MAEVPEHSDGQAFFCIVRHSDQINRFRAKLELIVREPGTPRPDAHPLGRKLSKKVRSLCRCFPDLGFPDVTGLDLEEFQDLLPDRPQMLTEKLVG
jgi:hypothetical protein